jgi:hypothetical protein
MMSKRLAIPIKVRVSQIPFWLEETRARTVSILFREEAAGFTFKAAEYRVKLFNKRVARSIFLVSGAHQQ